MYIELLDGSYKHLQICNDVALLHTLHGRSRRGQRRDPQYGAPNFRRCIVHFAHGRWNYTDCA